MKRQQQRASHGEPWGADAVSDFGDIIDGAKATTNDKTNSQSTKKHARPTMADPQEPQTHYPPPIGVCVSFPITGSKTRHDDTVGNYAFPTAIEPCSVDVGTDLQKTLTWAQENASHLEQQLTQTGALMFRGFPLVTAEDFQAFTEALGYDAEVYAGDKNAAHDELHQLYPHRVLFHCQEKKMENSFTPVFDSHRAYLKLKQHAPHFVEELETKGVRYVRVMTLDDRTDSPIGKGWRKTFKVNGPSQLEKLMQKERMGEAIEWLNEGEFDNVPGIDAQMYPVRHYSAVMDAVLVDPVDVKWSGRRFFNQVLAAHRGWTDVLNKPGRGVVFGDGTEIPMEAMAMMARVFEEESVNVPWQQGDVMLINNLQVMHSRCSGVKNGVVPRRALVKDGTSESASSENGTLGARGGAVASACGRPCARYSKAGKHAKKAQVLCTTLFAANGMIAYGR